MGDTVGELLSEKKIELGADDKINFATDYKIESGMTIKITRVAHTQVAEKEDISYKVIKKEDSSLKRGLTRVVKGELGQNNSHTQ